QLIARVEPRQLLREEIDDPREAVLGGGHGLHDVSGVAGMIVAEVGDQPPVVLIRGEEAGLLIPPARRRPEAPVGPPLRTMGQEELPALVEREGPRKLLLV